VDNAAINLEIYPVHHRRFHARTVRSKQFLIKALMQGLERSSVPRIVSVTGLRL